jgi:hypothetical protein
LLQYVTCCPRRKTGGFLFQKENPVLILTDINKRGVSILFVEQSVNLTLETAGCYIMQKDKVVEIDITTINNKDILKKASLG